MLPQPFRLKRSRLFVKTLGSAETLCSNPFFIVLGLPRLNTNDTPTRFGFIVSRKVSNRAVLRNKIKRRLRELVRGSLQAEESTPRLQRCISVVIIARTRILEASFLQLQQLFQRCSGNVA